MNNRLSFWDAHLSLILSPFLLSTVARRMRKRNGHPAPLLLPLPPLKIVWKKRSLLGPLNLGPKELLLFMPTFEPPGGERGKRGRKEEDIWASCRGGMACLVIVLSLLSFRQ